MKILNEGLPGTGNGCPAEAQKRVEISFTEEDIKNIPSVLEASKKMGIENTLIQFDWESALSPKRDGHSFFYVAFHLDRETEFSFWKRLGVGSAADQHVSLMNLKNELSQQKEKFSDTAFLEKVIIEVEK